MSWDKDGQRERTGRGVAEEAGRVRSQIREVDCGRTQQEGSTTYIVGPGGVRWARVLEVRAAIQDGSYRVPAEQVAESLLRFARRHHSAMLGMYSA